MRLYLRVEKRVYELEAPSGRVGSAPGLAVSLHDPSVLAEHAMFSWDGQSWWVTQLGAKPVFLDGAPLREHRERIGLQGGVQVGSVMMDFWQEGANPPRLAEAAMPTLKTSRYPTEQGSPSPVQIPAKLELLSLAQSRALRGDQIPTLIQAPGRRIEDPMKILASSIGRPASPGPGPVAQPAQLYASTLVQRKPVVAAPPAIAHSPYPSAEPPTHVAPPAPPTVQLNRPPENLPILEPPPQPVDRYMVAPAPPPVIQSQEATRPRVRWNWELAMQIGGLLGLLGLVCLFAFLFGVRSVPPIELPSR